MTSNITVRERLAMKMRESEPAPRGDWEDCYGPTKARYREQADAVIAHLWERAADIEEGEIVTANIAVLLQISEATGHPATSDEIAIVAISAMMTAMVGEKTEASDE